MLAGGAVDRGAGHGRHVDLGLDPGDRDLSDLGDLGGQGALFDEEDVGGESCALVDGLDVGDDAGDLDRLQAGELAAGDDDVVQLEVLLRADRHRELQRSGGDSADHQAYGTAAIQRSVALRDPCVARGDQSRLPVAD